MTAIFESNFLAQNTAKILKFLPASGALAVLAGPGVPHVLESHPGGGRRRREEGRRDLVASKAEPEKEEKQLYL